MEKTLISRKRKKRETIPAVSHMQVHERSMTYDLRALLKWRWEIKGSARGRIKFAAASVSRSVRGRWLPGCCCCYRSSRKESRALIPKTTRCRHADRSLAASRAQNRRTDRQTRGSQSSEYTPGQNGMPSSVTSANAAATLAEGLEKHLLMITKVICEINLFSIYAFFILFVVAQIPELISILIFFFVFFFCNY